jgi:hypothetical protein
MMKNTELHQWWIWKNAFVGRDLFLHICDLVYWSPIRYHIISSVKVGKVFMSGSCPRFAMLVRSQPSFYWKSWPRRGACCDY